jgi:aminoglycoside phosphotransferase (APT) family kinase protein
VLVIEDLSGARRPPPWSRGDVEAVLEALDAIHNAPAPAWVPSAVEWRDAGSWEVVSREPQPFLSLGLCTRAWLDAALPTLLAATEAAPFAGDALLHFDVRSDNICLRADRAVFVDWNWVAVGNPAVDVAGWLPSLASEGGELPRVPEADPFAAWVSGFFAARAGLPPPATALRVREVQLAQLREALPWAVQVFGLPPLDHS